MFLLRLLSLFVISSIAFAHDPALHAQEADKTQQPIDCRNIQTSSPSNDPVHQAIVQKCEKAPTNNTNSPEMKNHKMDDKTKHEQHMQH